MTRIASLAEVLTPRNGEELVSDRDYPIAGVLGFGRGLLLRQAIKGCQTKYKSFTRLLPGDVVYSKIKAFEGAVTVVSHEGDGRYVSPEFPVFALDEAVDPGFLKHFLASDAFMAELRSTSSGIGARRERVHPAAFLRLTFPWPSRAEQGRIASHLDSLQTEARRVATLSGGRQAAIAAFANHPWSGESAQIREIVQPVARAETVEADSTYRMLGVRWYGRGLFVREVKLGRDLAARSVYRVTDGDLVYNRLFAWKQSFALAQLGFDAFVSNEFPTFRIDDSRILPRFLLAELLTRPVMQQIDDASTGSTPTSRNRLKVLDFLDLRIEIPSVDVQRQVVSGLRLGDRILELDGTQRARGDALLPAARNEIFSAMR